MKDTLGPREEWRRMADAALPCVVAYSTNLDEAIEIVRAQNAIVDERVLVLALGHHVERSAGSS